MGSKLQDYQKLHSPELETALMGNMVTNLLETPVAQRQQHHSRPQREGKENRSVKSLEEPKGSSKTFLKDEASSMTSEEKCDMAARLEVSSLEISGEGREQSPPAPVFKETPKESGFPKPEAETGASIECKKLGLETQTRSTSSSPRPRRASSESLEMDGTTLIGSAAGVFKPPNHDTQIEKPEHRQEYAVNPEDKSDPPSSSLETLAGPQPNARMDAEQEGKGFFSGEESTAKAPGTNTDVIGEQEPASSPKPLNQEPSPNFAAESLANKEEFSDHDAVIDYEDTGSQAPSQTAHDGSENLEQQHPRPLISYADPIDPIAVPLPEMQEDEMDLLSNERYKDSNSKFTPATSQYDHDPQPRASKPMEPGTHDEGEAYVQPSESTLRSRSPSPVNLATESVEPSHQGQAGVNNDEEMLGSHDLKDEAGLKRFSVPVQDTERKEMQPQTIPDEPPRERLAEGACVDLGTEASTGSHESAEIPAPTSLVFQSDKEDEQHPPGDQGSLQSAAQLDTERPSVNEADLLSNPSEVKESVLHNSIGSDPFYDEDLQSATQVPPLFQPRQRSGGLPQDRQTANHGEPASLAERDSTHLVQSDRADIEKDRLVQGETQQEEKDGSVDNSLPWKAHGGGGASAPRALRAGSAS
ncbi:hypothetical protein KEM55_003875, partial [Ascosphaera atra]